jgi:hypothetical protein
MVDSRDFVPMRAVVTAALAVLACLLPGAAAWNYTLGVSNDDRRVIELGAFAFAEGGMMELLIQQLSVPADEPPGKIGFTVDLVATAADARQERKEAGDEAKRHHTCFVDDTSFIGKRPRFHIPLDGAIGETNPLVAANVSFAVTVPGLYATFFYNCRAPAGTSRSSFRVHVKQYNTFVGTDGTRKISFLSVGDDNLPAMYVVFALFFLAGFVAWIRIVRDAPPHRVFAVHRMMHALVLIKCITLLLEAAVLHHRQQTGALKYGLDYIYYAFQTLRGIMLFTVILLLGTGWSTLKPFLSERDKRILYVILPLQVGVNVALAVLDESSEGNKSWARYRGMLRIFDLICCCAVLLPVVWSIKSFRDAGIGTERGRTSRTLGRLQQFRTFYLAVVAFVYFTRVMIPLSETKLPYYLTWAPAFMYEASAVLFYAFCGLKFRPTEADTMFTPANDDDDAGEVDLGDA